jgi:hypothetical protein
MWKKCEKQEKRENVRKKKQENRNKCADISLEISAIRCEIWEKMWKMEAAEIK